MLKPTAIEVHLVHKHTHTVGFCHAVGICIFNNTDVR